MNQNKNIMKMNNQNPKQTYLTGITLFVFASALFATACSGEKPVYMKTNERLYAGSIYYVQAECTSCHGGDWDGNGPETKNMKAQGFDAVGFTGEVPADKTPVDYFKAISDPASHFAGKKSKVAEANYNRFIGMHSYHSMTDRARWSIAHFLFSRHAGDPYSKNKSAINEKMKEAEKAYSANRRWEIGYIPIAKRSIVPTLDEMISTSHIKPVPESSMPSVNDERKSSATVISGTGYKIYRNNCQACHGQFAEGKSEGTRVGLLNSGPRFDTDKGINRKSMAFVSIRDLAFSPAINQLGAFKSAHANNSSMMIPSTETFTDSEWEDLFNYTKGLTGR